MKLLSVLVGLLFVFSVSQKAFACPCNEGKAGKAPASTTVADAKDAQKDMQKTDATTEKACGCEKAGKECKCKDCGCGKHKDADKTKGKDKAHSKHGKDCGCDKTDA